MRSRRCRLTATTAAAQDYFFRIPHVTSANEPVHEALEHFAALIEERSGGRIEAEVFPGGQLGTNLEMYEQVDLGAEIIILADPGYLSNFMPDWGILNGPYLLDAPEDFQKIVASDWYAGMVGELRDTTNLELLALNWFFGDRNVISDTGGSAPSTTSRGPLDPACPLKPRNVDRHLRTPWARAANRSPGPRSTARLAIGRGSDAAEAAAGLHLTAPRCRRKRERHLHDRAFSLRPGSASRMNDPELVSAPCPKNRRSALTTSGHRPRATS